MGETRPSIVVENVGKRFDLHQARRGSFRELLARKRSEETRPESAFWALENVTFTVEPGHPLAIIGHNGSGKSTLLKLLTGILKPTKGAIDIRGRIGALIEVGAGFHPDLTGRENVYLNGSILGASKREMDARFDHIVAFAGLERFIDTPVKRYSTGMYMRLGFSIAAHLEPDILLIDEVLAVGDAQFQTRCLTYLKEFVRKGGSVVFVSHAMGQVRELCDRCVWLDRGQMMGFGEAGPLIDRYESLVVEREDAEFQKLYPDEWAAQKREKRLTALVARREDARASRREARVRLAEERRLHEARRREGELERFRAYEQAWQLAPALPEPLAEVEEELLPVAESPPERDPAERFAVVEAQLLDRAGKPVGVLRVGEPSTLLVRYRAGRALESPVIGVDFLRVPDDLHLFTVSNYDHRLTLPTPGEGAIAVRIPAMVLGQAHYRVRISTYPECVDPEWFLRPEHVVESAVEFAVDAGRFANGCAYLETCWEIEAR